MRRFIFLTCLLLFHETKWGTGSAVSGNGFARGRRGSKPSLFPILSSNNNGGSRPAPQVGVVPVPAYGPTQMQQQIPNLQNQGLPFAVPRPYLDASPQQNYLISNKNQQHPTYEISNFEPLNQQPTQQQNHPVASEQPQELQPPSQDNQDLPSTTQDDSKALPRPSIGILSKPPSNLQTEDGRPNQNTQTSSFVPIPSSPQSPQSPQVPFQSSMSSPASGSTVSAQQPTSAHAPQKPYQQTPWVGIIYQTVTPTNSYDDGMYKPQLHGNGNYSSNHGGPQPYHLYNNTGLTQMAHNSENIQNSINLVGPHKLKYGGNSDNGWYFHPPPHYSKGFTRGEESRTMTSFDLSDAVV